MAGLGNEDYFNPSVSDPSTSFLHYSRGIEAPQAQAYSSTTAPLITGLGDELGLVTEGIDTNIKEDIKKQIATPDTGIVDRARDDDLARLYGAGHGGAQNAPSPATEAIDNKVSTMQQLDQARKSGKVSESSYWLALEAASRQLREQYAGHREYIDQQFSQLTGHIPANALQASLRQDAAAAAAGSNKEQEFIESAAKEGTLPPNMLSRLNTENVPFHEVVNSVAQVQWQKAQVAYHNAAAEASKNDQDQAWRKREDAMGLEVNGIFTGTIPNQLTDVRKHIADLDSGAYSAEKLKDLHNTSEALFSKIEDQVSQISLKYTGLLPQDRIKAMSDNAEEQIKILRHNINDPTDGSAHFSATVNNATLAAAEGDLLKNPGYARGVTFVKNMGSQAFSDLMSKSDQEAIKQGKDSPYGNWLKITAYALAGDAQDGKPDASLNNHTDQLIQKGATDPLAFKTYVETNKAMITSPEADPVAKKNAIMSTYNTDGEFLKNVDGSSTTAKGVAKIPENIKAFDQLTRPELAKSIYDTKDPQAIGQYEAFVYKGTQKTAGQSIADMQQAAQAGVKIDFDPVSHRFTIADVPRDSKFYSDPNSAVLVNNTRYAQTKVDSLNTSLRPMIDMLERRGSKDIGKDLGQLLGPLGMPTITTPDAAMHLFGSDNAQITAKEYGAPQWQGNAPRENTTAGAPQANPLQGLEQEFTEALAGYKANPTPESERYLKTIYGMYKETQEQPQPPGLVGIPTNGPMMKSGTAGGDMDKNYLQLSVPGKDAFENSLPPAKPGENDNQMWGFDKDIGSYPMPKAFDKVQTPETSPKFGSAVAAVVRNREEAEGMIKYFDSQIKYGNDAPLREKQKQDFINSLPRNDKPMMIGGPHDNDNKSNVVQFPVKPDPVSAELSRAGAEAAAEGPKVNDQLTVRDMNRSVQKYKNATPVRGDDMTQAQANKIIKDFKLDTQGQKIHDEDTRTHLEFVQRFATQAAEHPDDEIAAKNLRISIYQANKDFERGRATRESINSLRTPTEVPGMNLTGGAIKGPGPGKKPEDGLLE